MAPRFPDGILLKKYQGRVMQVQHHNYQLERLFAEKFDPDLVQRVALFEGKRIEVEDEEPVVIKLRFEMDPEDLPEEERPIVLRMATKWFEEEWSCIRDCETSEHTPRFYGQAKLVQQATDLFPGGYLHVLVMSKAPGSPVTTFKKFTSSEIDTIRQQLTATLEHIRLRGWSYFMPDIDDLLFDRDSMHISLAGFAGIHPVPPEETSRVTETSYRVEDFGLAGLPRG